MINRFQKLRAAVSKCFPRSYYAWELYDADDVMVAGGEHYNRAGACNTAAHYYSQYAQDGPHRYTVEKRTVVMEVNPTALP